MNHIEDDDDIQDYKEAWVGLTEADIENCIHKVEKTASMFLIWSELLRQN